MSNIKFYQPVIHYSKRLFTPLAIVFLSYFIWQSRVELSITFQQANIFWLFSSIVLWMLLHIISPIFTIIIMNSWSYQLNYSQALRIHSKRLPAKYLPGGIWHTVARATDYHNFGIKQQFVGCYLLVENLLAASITLTLGGSIVLHLLNDNLWFLLVETLIFSAISIILFLPWLVNKKVLPIHTSLLMRPYCSGVCCLIFYWIIAASAFTCFLQAFPTLNLMIPYITTGGIYIFSWGIGFISLFAPQGIGVSELVCEELLETSVSNSHFIALLASFRLIALIADLMTYGLSNFIFQTKK